MVKKIKFGDLERQRVIKNIEKLKDIKLSPVGGKKKYLAGSDGNYYCIVGGSEDWHGIPNEIIDQGITNPNIMFMVVARLLATRIEIYMGSMKKIIESRSALKRTKTCDYQFDIKSPEGNKLGVRQVAGVNLYKINEFTYDVSAEREQDNKIRDYIKKLSSAELKNLIKELGIKIDA